MAREGSQNRKMPHRSGISRLDEERAERGDLDAYAELAGLLLTGVGVKVIGSALLEL